MKKSLRMDLLRFKDTPEIRRFLYPFHLNNVKQIPGEGEKFYGIELYCNFHVYEFRVYKLSTVDLLALKLIAIDMKTI